MDYLPQDLKKFISQYIDYTTIPAYVQLVPSLENSDFLIRSLIQTLGFTKDQILKLWNLPEHFYNLTLYQNYVRVLAYFGYILPESDMFLSQEQCYSLAAKLGDKAMTHRFGKLLGYKDTPIDKFMDSKLGPITKLIKGKSDQNLNRYQEWSLS